LFSVIIINYLKVNIMDGVFDIKSTKWLGGNNVHNTLALVGIALLVYKAYK